MAKEEPVVPYPMEKEAEMDRLSNQHDVVKDAMGGNLLFAKLDLSTQPCRILDSGTADGTWIRDLAGSSRTVHHQFFGTDIDLSNFPANPPQGITYQQQDINKAWPEDWKASFDLVHQRFVLVAAGSQQKESLHSLAELVKPGGWIQVIEATNVLPSCNGPVMRSFVALMNDVFSIMGASLSLTEELPSWLAEAGFERIESTHLDLQLGSLNPNPHLGKQGVFSTSTASTGLATFAKTLPPASVSLKPEQLDTLGADLMAELSQKGGVYPIKIVVGRKPA